MAAASGDVQEAAQCFPDDLTRRGVIGLGASFDRRAQLRVDSDRHDIGRS